MGDVPGENIAACLIGANTVYAHEDMSSWVDGQKLNHHKNMGICTLRYPKGHQTSFWDWEFPYHEPYKDLNSPFWGIQE